MTPPLESLGPLRRAQKSEDPRKIYLLYEGTNTEPLFVTPMLANNPEFAAAHVVFYPLNKTLNDSGATQPHKLIDLAKAWIAQQKQETFASGRDKVLIVADLDIYQGNQAVIDAQVRRRLTSDIIFAFTNPAIELILLLEDPKAWDELIEPNKKAILKNAYAVDPATHSLKLTDDGDPMRFVFSLFYEKYGRINPKKADFDARRFYLNSSNIEMLENMYLNHWLSQAANKLSSNIFYVLRKIKEGRIDDIQYES